MLRLGIAGIGTIAKDYIGLIADGRVPGVTLAALCSRNPDSMAAVLRQYPSITPRVFTDYGAMLQSGAIDGVLICTPHGQHPAMTLAAVEAGLHVLCEKPVGIDADAVEGVLAALEKQPELVCGVMYNRRASGAYRKVKTLVEDGVLGELVRATWVITNLYRTNAYYASGAWRGTWETEGGGLLMTQASHQLDLMQWLCGMPVSVLAQIAAVERNIQVENEAQLFLTYPNGARGQFIASAHECPGTNRLELCGTRGSIIVTDDSAVELVRLQTDEGVFAAECPNPFDKPPMDREQLFFDDSDNKIQQAATLQNFADAVSGRATIQCSLAQGLCSLQIIQAAYVSAWQQRPVTMPLPGGQFGQAMQAHKETAG
ncbi:MAG: Gfo/Idh/MocA family oxidoreductase [Oscillospiraceae bacterium]